MIRVSRAKNSVSSGFVAVICRGTGFAPDSGGELKDLQPARVTCLAAAQRRRLGWGRFHCSCRRNP